MTGGPVDLATQSQIQGLARSRGALGRARLLEGSSRPDGESWLEHRSRLGGPISEAVGRMRPAQLVTRVRHAGLTGRGGAGFPTAEKLAAVLGQHRGRVVVGNGSETEPASAKDDLLLRLRPHLVLDGLEGVATALRAERTFLVVPTSLAHRQVTRALLERGAEGRYLSGVKVVLGPPNFVGGEETAVVRWLEGFPAVPRFRPPLSFERGWRGRPTLVQSVETLAHLGLIARFGSDWFRQVGTSEEPGTRLVTLSGAVARAGVYEMPNWMGLAGLLEAAGSDPAAAALLVGGYSGSWLTPGQFPEAQISQAGLGKFNATLGAGVVHLLAPGSCAVWEAHRIVRWLAGQSAGPCGPCSHGLPALAEALGQLAQPLHASHQGVRLVKTLEHPG